MIEIQTDSLWPAIHRVAADCKSRPAGYKRAWIQAGGPFKPIFGLNGADLRSLPGPKIRTWGNQFLS